MLKPEVTFSIKVPTKTYLRKYLQALYPNEFYLTHRSEFGPFILPILEKEYLDIRMNNEKIGRAQESFDDEITFTASMQVMAATGHSLTPAKIIAINRMLADQFPQDLYLFCMKTIRERKWRPGTADAIYMFAEMCGIEIDVDISFDALKKAEYRQRLKLEKKFATFVPGAGSGRIGASSFLSTVWPSTAFAS